MSFVQVYLLVGLGSWLYEKSVVYAYPEQDLSAGMEIANFLGVLALWPVAIGVGYYASHKRRVAVMEEYTKLLYNVSRSSESDQNEQDKG